MLHLRVRPRSVYRPMLDSQDDFRALFENAPDALFTLDLQSRITRVNSAFERLTGYTRPGIIGKPVSELVASEHLNRFQMNLLQRLGGARAEPLEVDLVTASKARIALELTTDLIFSGGQPAGIQCFARDVTDRRREIQALASAKAELTEMTRQLAAFTRHLRVVHRLSSTPYSDIDTLFSDYLSAGCEIFGVPSGAICLGTEEGLARCCFHGEHSPEPHADEVARERRTVQTGGDSSPVYIGTPLFVNGSLAGTIGFWSQTPAAPHPHAREIVELMARGIASALHQRQLTDQLEHLATHDSLTELPNRLLLASRLEAALADARASNTRLAVLFIDLDRFKGINDSLGHAIGDSVLRELGHRLRTCVRPGDTLARMGGDEFTAILPNIQDRAEVLEIARKFLNAVHEPCRVQGYELFVTASIGISMFPRDGSDAGTLLRNADAAMYAAKRRGSDDVQLYAAEETTIAIERLSIETSLRRALDRNEFTLVFQPQVHLDGRLTGAEVLLGWQHPELGRVPPKQFIPIAEETGMILSIGDWVLRRACHQASEWARASKHRIVIAVNVSAVQFTQPGFVRTVADALAESGLPAELLELEVTESLLLRDLHQVAASFRELRKLGVQIAVDDFGTGYSSLSYIRNLPLDALKIDRSFLADAENERAALALLKAIVALGHTLGLTVTAEGVETPRQLELVSEAGCDQAQGHLFGYALDAASLGELLKSDEPVLLPPGSLQPAR